MIDISTAKLHLRVDDNDEDALIGGYILAAEAWIKRVTGKEFAEGAPEDIQQAAAMLVAHWYDQRAAASDEASRPVPFGVRALVAGHRSFAHGPTE